MPFINLPTLDKDQREQIDQALDQTQSQTGTLRSEIADFRSGVTDKVDKVEAAANKLNERIQNARDRVAKLDSKMAALKAFSIRMQHDIPIIFNTTFVILSLLFAFVVWTQVEMIRNYAARWRLLGQGEESVTLPVETLAQPVAIEPLSIPVDAPAVSPTEEPAKPVKKASPAKPAKVVKKTKPANK
jgi:hypothetical protein